jgi:hypothetical protein
MTLVFINVVGTIISILKLVGVTSSANGIRRYFLLRRGENKNNIEALQILRNCFNCKNSIASELFNMLYDSLRVF